MFLMCVSLSSQTFFNFKLIPGLIGLHREAWFWIGFYGGTNLLNIKDLLTTWLALMLLDRKSIYAYASRPQSNQILL